MTEQERIDVLQDMAVHSHMLPDVIQLAKTVFSRLPSGAGEREIAAEALSSAQHLEYHPHPEVAEPFGDFFQRPDYTIDHGGNCEDLSVTLVAVLAHLGITAMTVWVFQKDRPLNHVAVQVLLGNSWEWADPTIGPAKLGESPYQSLARLSDSLHPADARYRAKRPYTPNTLRSGHAPSRWLHV
jgi:hypothetical protein